MDDPSNAPFKTNDAKRVIGMPGDRIEVRGARVYINGQLLPEHHVTAENLRDKFNTPELEDNAPLYLINDPPRSAK